MMSMTTVSLWGWSRRSRRQTSGRCPSSTATGWGRSRGWICNKIILQHEVKIILKTLLIFIHILVRARHGGFYRAAQMIRPHQVVRLRRSLLIILVIVIIKVSTKMKMKLPGREIGQGQVQRHLVADLGDSASLQNPTQGLVRGPLWKEHRDNFLWNCLWIWADIPWWHLRRWIVVKSCRPLVLPSLAAYSSLELTSNSVILTYSGRLVLTTILTLCIDHCIIIVMVMVIHHQYLYTNDDDDDDDDADDDDWWWIIMIDDDADPSIMAVLRPIVAGLSPDHAHSLNIIVSIIIILLILIIIIIFFWFSSLS